jgi:hypothetical protein
MAMINLNHPWILQARHLFESDTGSTMNAAGESNFCIGQIFWKGGTSGATKVLSAAGGGSIYWNAASSLTFANAGTQLDIGIQDVAATGFEDGTFDVSGTLIGGTDTITDNALHVIPMETGSKTLTYRQIVAVGATMVTRAGVDQVTIDRVEWSGTLNSSGFPYGTHLSSRTSLLPCFTIKFDDGTYGWINLAPLAFNTTNTGTAISYNSGSTPDEYVCGITLPFKARIVGYGWKVGGVATADTFEICAYLDPFGSPSLIETAFAPDPDILVTDRPLFTLLDTPYDLEAGAVFGGSIRPTSVNNITITYFDLTTGFDVLKNTQLFSTIKMGSRTDNTGAFAETQTYHLPDFYLLIGGVEAGAGALVGSLVNGGKVR